MAEPKHCPSCGRTNPPEAQVCVCGDVLDPDTRKREKEAKEELEKYERAQEEKRARRRAEIESASVVRIVDIEIPFANLFWLSIQFWFASLLIAAVVGSAFAIFA